MIDTKALIQTITRHINAGELDAAGNILFAHWQKDKTNPDIHVLRARLAMASGDVGVAAEFLTAAENLSALADDPAQIQRDIVDIRFAMANPDAPKEAYPSAQPVYKSEYEKWLRTEAFQPIRPLLDGQLKFAIFFNAHCANTTIANWYFKRLGLMHAIELLCDVKRSDNSSVVSDFNSAMHIFRRSTYYESPFYQSNEERFLDFVHGDSEEAWHSYKFVRNPYRRLVGVYLLHMRENETAYGQSFREFVTAMENEDLSIIDMHMRPQVFNFEKSRGFNFNRVFKVEEEIGLHLSTILRDTGGLSDEDSAAETLESRNFTNYADASSDCVSDVNFLGEVFAGKTAPSVESFFDRSLFERVYALYEDDFRTYAYALGEV
jgi:hypothetical protein